MHASTQFGNLAGATARPAAGPASRLVSGLLAAILSVPACGLSQDSGPKNSGPQDFWPQWRGPSRDGLVPGVRLPAQLDEAPRLAWSQPLGTGWSSPVVVGSRVIVMDRQGSAERVLALDTGEGTVLWTAANPVDFDPHAVGRRHGNGPKATPVVQGEHVFTLGIAGWLQCLKLDDGRPVWQRHLPADFGSSRALPSGRAFVDGTEQVIVPIGEGRGAAVPLFGHTGSPVFAHDLLVLAVGGERGGTLMAFDAATGAPRWRALQDRLAYASPVVAAWQGVVQVIAMTGPRVVGLAMESGELLWSHPFQIQYDESICTPVVAGEMVLVTGDRRPLTALRVERRGDSWNATVAWENRELSSYLSTAVAAPEHVYGMNDGGEFACVRLRDGQTLWTGGNDGFYCSPLLADRRLIGLNEQGWLQILEATPDRYSLLARHRVSSSATWS